MNRPLFAALGLVLDGPLQAAAETRTVEMKKFKFRARGDHRQGGGHRERRQYHTVWFREAGDPETLEPFPGDTCEKTFAAPGDYPYVAPHEKDGGMKGIVHVVEG